MSDQNQIKKEGKELDPQMKIYLLVGPGCSDLRRNVGFKALGSGEEFTFAFSSLEKLEAFANYQTKRGVLGYTGHGIRTWWLTLEEYFAKPNNNLLYIDPPEDFPLDFGLPNPN